MISGTKSAILKATYCQKGGTFVHHLKRTARWLAACLGLLLLLSPMLPASSIHTGRSDSDFKVVAYYPSWRPDSQRSKLQYDIVTHINYAFAIPTQDGGLKPLENASGAKKLIGEAHANGVKVLLAVGGWSDQDVLLEPVFASATATTAKRSRLVNEIVAMCDQYGFDGVDIDWEYPRTSGTYRQYEQLLSALSQRLHAQGKLLTTAVIGGAHHLRQPLLRGSRLYGPGAGDGGLDQRHGL